MKKCIGEVSNKRKLFQKIIHEANKKNPNLKLETLVKIINHIDPNFLKGINEESVSCIQQLNNRRCVCGIKECRNTGKDHSEGFENEELYQEALWGHTKNALT